MTLDPRLKCLVDYCMLMIWNYPLKSSGGFFLSFVEINASKIRDYGLKVELPGLASVL